jgi:hypothetical protein
VNRVDELLGREVPMRSMALLRTLAGPIVLLHLWPFLDDARHGRIYRDAFHQPYASWYPELPRDVYVALLVVAAVAAIAMTVGVAARVATITAFAIVTYNLFLSTTNYHHNRAYLVVVLGALALARSDDPDGAAPAWPLWLLRIEAATVYATSGVSKLLDHDWWSGAVTWERVVRVQQRLVTDTPLPRWAIDVLTDRRFHTVAAKVIIATELFIALGMWSRRTRYAAVWVAVVFHVAIEITASVQVFSYLAIAALVIWAVPSTRDRVLHVDATSRSHRRLVRAVTSLDWLARFRIDADRPPGASVAVDDRDGTTLEGRRAGALVFSRLPLTAWFALPVRATWR